MFLNQIKGRTDQTTDSLIQLKIIKSLKKLKTSIQCSIDF